ncbi:MAG: hypothetical protein KDD44_14000, partial [Bdellovibrionales bacterium]|nr:hypothetical protein [Bdellovibrionales bacterium]
AGTAVARNMTTGAMVSVPIPANAVGFDLTFSEPGLWAIDIEGVTVQGCAQPDNFQPYPIVVR